MDVREKLIEILRKPIFPHELVDTTEAVADYLLDSGVTVQEWISVKDRLPEENGRYLTANKRYDDKIGVFDLWFDGGFWYIDDVDDMFDYEVTHWMPMPHPPKGE